MHKKRGKTKQRFKMGTLISGIVLGVLFAFLVGGGACVVMLSNFGGGSYEDYEKIERQEQMQAFTQIKQKASMTDATAYNKWAYNVILRDSQVRELLEMEMSQETADVESNKLLQQAVKAEEPSALVQSAYYQLAQGMGLDKVTDYYNDYESAKVVDEKALENGLTILIQLQRQQCNTLGNISILEYPYYSEYFDEEVQFKESTIGEYLDRFNRRSLVNYPKLEDKLDIIELRRLIHCSYGKGSRDEIGKYLTKQKSEIYLPLNQSPVREAVFLSVLAELHGLTELVPIFGHYVAEKDKQSYQEQRQSLSSAYHDAYADVVPVDSVVFQDEE